MPEALTYRCPFCDRDARVGVPCPGCMAKQVGQRKKGASAASNRKPESWESSEEIGDDFDYEDFCKREFGKASCHRTSLKWYWWYLAVIVLAGMAAAAFWIR